VPSGIVVVAGALVDVVVRIGGKVSFDAWSVVPHDTNPNVAGASINATTRPVARRRESGAAPPRFALPSARLVTARHATRADGPIGPGLAYPRHP
jgi:hypothetical protein